MEDFNILEEKEKIETQLKNSQEIEELTNTLDVNNMNSLVTFGSKVAEEIAKSSDVILNNMTNSCVNNSGDVMSTLSQIMSNVDFGELKNIDRKKGLFDNLFSNNIEKILEKYNVIGSQIDRIYIKLREYEENINNTNVNLENLFISNVNTYKELIKYIMAGNKAIQEIDEYIEKCKINNINFNFQHLENAKSILSKRVNDLKITEIIAMQSLPMIKSMQYTNVNLSRKINSAFIITIPIFKQTLSQAIQLKRQKIQKEGLKALDEKTNEILLKNPNNAEQRARIMAQLTENSSIKIEILEKTCKTILEGIDETKKIQEDARKRIEEDSIKLRNLNKNSI